MGIFTFLTLPYISTILLAIGFIFLLIEVFIGIYGAAALISIISFGLYFISNYYVNNISLWPLFVFIAGLILLFIELMMPGISLPGITGTILIIVGIMYGSKNFLSAIISLLVSLLACIFTGIIIYKYFPDNKFFKKLVLKNKATNEEGFTSVDDYKNLVGKTGTAETVLRPSGMIIVDGKRYDAVTEGAFIEKGAAIIVSEVEGMRIVVKIKSD